MKTVAWHALAVYAGQIAVIGFGVTDTIVAGRYSELSLAALSVGAAIFIMVFVSLMGLLTALLPIWAEMHGAGRPEAIGPSVRQSLYVLLGTCVLGLVPLLHPDPILRWTRVPDELRGIVIHYLHVLGWGLPAALAFRIYATLNQALGKPQLVSWLQLVSLLIKIPLSVWFAFGGYGLGAMGVVGCAWASTVVYWFLLGLALVLLLSQRLYVPLFLWTRLERPKWQTLSEFLRLGVPAAITISVEVTSFTLMALFIARLGTTAAAAHQIAVSVVEILFMMPLSMGVAASARVGFWRGAGNERRARAVALQSCHGTLVLAAFGAAVILLFGARIVAIYTTHPEVAALAMFLLFWIAIFHIADALQTVAIFILRCYRITVAPMLIYVVLLWGVGLTGGYMLTYRGIGPLVPQMTPAAFWQAAIVGLSITAASVYGLLAYASCRLGRP